MDELTEAICHLRLLFPDWRMGQLVANLVMAAGGDDDNAIWDMEDEQLLAAARRLIERNRGRQVSGIESCAASERGGMTTSAGPKSSRSPANNSNSVSATREEINGPNQCDA
jgi:hypothetical protein